MSLVDGDLAVQLPVPRGASAPPSYERKTISEVRRVQIRLLENPGPVFERTLQNVRHRAECLLHLARAIEEFADGLDAFRTTPMLIESIATFFALSHFLRSQLLPGLFDSETADLLI